MEKQITDALEDIKEQARTRIDELSEHVKMVQDQADKLDIKMQRQGNTVNVTNNTLEFALKNAFVTNESRIKNIDKEVLSYKSILTTSVTGGNNHTFAQGAVLKPNALYDVVDLISNTQIMGGSYSYAVETVSGAPAKQTEGNAKANVDVTFEYKTVDTSFIAGVSKVSRQFLNNYSSLAKTLPAILEREFKKAENTLYATELFLKATASTVTGTTKVETLVKEVSEMFGANVSPTVVVVNPTDYSDILLNKASTSGIFNVPNAMTITSDGMVRILGVPLVMANWCTVDNYLVFDGSTIIDAVQQQLNLMVDNSQYFDQNMVVMRIEKQSNIAVTAPFAIRKGTFTDPEV